jgi:hypothetical protein
MQRVGHSVFSSLAIKLRSFRSGLENRIQADLCLHIDLLVKTLYEQLSLLVSSYLKQKLIRSHFTITMAGPNIFPFPCRYFIPPFSEIEIPAVTVQERIIEHVFCFSLGRLAKVTLDDPQLSNIQNLAWLQNFSSRWISCVLERLAYLMLDRRGSGLRDWRYFDCLLDQLKYLPDGCQGFFSQWLKRSSTVSLMMWRKRWKIFLM